VNRKFHGKISDRFGIALINSKWNFVIDKTHNNLKYLVVEDSISMCTLYTLIQGKVNFSILE
jgi:hypothetical protein